MSPRRFHSQSTILLYHRIADVRPDLWSICVTPEHFSQHLEVLARHRCVRLDQLKPGGWTFREEHTVTITFDDGYADNFEFARPMLEKRGIPATFFITTGSLATGREFWWDELQRLVCEYSPSDSIEERVAKDTDYFGLYEKLRPLSAEERDQVLNVMAADRGEITGARRSHRTMTMNEIGALAAEPLFEVGAHTVTHPLLVTQSPAQQFSEINTSKRCLEDVIGRPVRSFAYPYGGSGHYSPMTVEGVRAAGFVRACTTVPKPVIASNSPFEWGRFYVTDIDGEQFEKFLFE